MFLLFGAMEFFVVVKVWFKKWLDFDPGINTIGRVCRGGKIVAIRNLFFNLMISVREKKN